MKYKSVYPIIFQRLVFILMVSFCSNLFAQDEAPGIIISCSGDDIHEASVPSNLRIKVSEKTSHFVCTYFDTPSEIQTVINDALAVWEQVLISEVPINLHVYLADLKNETLAQAGSDKVYRNFYGAPLKNVWYPAALAEAISGEPINGDSPDIILNINKNINWILNASSDLPGQGSSNYDLHTVVLHEIAHGVGFLSSFVSHENGTASWGVENQAYCYDSFITDTEERTLIETENYKNSSSGLLDILESNAVYFKIDSGEYQTNRIKLYAPNPFSKGASLSHFSRNSYWPDSRDAIMYSSISGGASYTWPGNATLAVLYQLGWALNNYELGREYPVNPNLPSFDLYPNPVNETLYVKLRNFDVDNYPKYKIWDLNGKILQSGILENEESAINISKLRSGKYLLFTEGLSLPFLKY